MKKFETTNTFVTGIFPDTVADDSTGAATQDGFEYIAANLNNSQLGPQQAIMDYAAGNSNPDVGAVGVPNGVTEAAGASQIIEAMHKMTGTGPGTYRQWGKFDDPSVTGDRVLLLSGQGVLVASFPDLNAAVWVGGDTANNQAVKDAGGAFYRADDAGGVTVNAAGAWLILSESRDYLFPNGPRLTRAYWHTVNGYGSTNNKIQKFVTNVDASNDVVVTVVNDATNGFSITANMSCFLWVQYIPHFSGAGIFGLSKNSSQLTTSIAAITTADALGFETTQAADKNANFGWSGSLITNDVIRPHTAGATDGSVPTQGRMHVFAIEQPRENSATVQGIIY